MAARAESDPPDDEAVIDRGRSVIWPGKSIALHPAQFAVAQEQTDGVRERATAILRYVKGAGESRFVRGTVRRT